MRLTRAEYEAALKEIAREEYEEYEAAVKEVAAGISDDYELDSPECMRFLEMVCVVEGYEKKHFPIDPPTPEEAAAFRKEQEEPEPL